MFSVITLLSSATLVFGLVFSKKKGLKIEKAIKILAVIFFISGIARMHLSDSFVETVFSGADIAESLVRWCYYIGYAIIPLSIFMDCRLFRNVAVYFSLTMSIIAALRFDTTMNYFLSPGGGGWYVAEWFRYVFFVFELTLAISLPLLMKYNTGHKFDLENKSDTVNFALALPYMLLYMMPPYIPQSLLGFTSIPVNSFSDFHIAWIIITVVEIVGIYLVFRKKSDKEKYALLSFIVLAEFYLSNSSLLRGFKLSRIPIQLCCVAAFFYLFVILTKSKKMFNFCYLCNLSGAFVAVVLASFTPGALQCWNIHYMYEHTMVLAFPILAMALGVFPKLTKASIKDMTIRYVSYFAFCLIIGLVFNSLSPTRDYYEVNYFYMFDYNEAISYLPFVSFLGAIKIPFYNVTIYPLLTVTVFVIFYLLALANYAITKLVYRLCAVKRNAVKEQKEEENLLAQVA